MLAAFFRGAFIIGILAWYSISVWKMIDGYFRDQFASYLHEEYRKNPHMKAAHMKDAVNEVGKNDAVHTDGEVPSNRIDELVKAESCPVDKVDDDKILKSCNISEKILKVDRPNDSLEKEILVKISTEKELNNDDDDDDDDDKDKDERQTMKSIEKMADEEKRLKKKEFPSSKEFEEEIEKKKKKKKKEDEKEKEKGREREREKKKKEEEEKTKKQTKKRVKTITLNEEDFLSVKNRRGTIGRDEDFWEFEEDEEKQKIEDEEVGILISDLPFKPKLDIGRLERITPDEYCPLTLDDELSCRETTKWP
ncbi:myb-like protein X [Vespa velutina]|uniref:myb-like protein X n=1 Tax=Vespa velutina TaxID=202808 RepID=UPI001FB43582|nr:myb-like protein X [Vespa velutina]